MTRKEFYLFWFGISEAIAFVLSCVLGPIAGVPVSLGGLLWLSLGLMS